MSADPGREPVIAGWAQLSDRGSEADGNAPSPEQMLLAVGKAALERSGRPEGMLAALDSVGFVDSVSWQIPDPARILADDLGAEDVETVRTLTGGISPIELLADACTRIRDGEAEAVLIAGVECFDVLMRAMKDGRDPGFATQPPGTEPDRTIGKLGETSHPVELAAGLIAPVAYYPLFEEAVRARAGRTPAEHQEYLGRLWARFAEVAALNPHAWSREDHSAERIATPSAQNRQVSIPYTKLMNSNIQTNQAAALLVCSAATAEAAGVERRAQVRVRGTATAADHAFPSERVELDRSPALARCASAVLGHAGIAIDDVEHLDIYSCFPSAVAVAGRELGVDLFDPDRAPTVTGGLSFAGGPGSNYVTHSLAALCERISEAGGSGVATGVGWYLTKHGVVLLSELGEPGAGTEGEGEADWQHFSPQAEIDAGPRREVVVPPESGRGTIEAYTAICDREGRPEVAIATFLVAGAGGSAGDPPEARTVAKADDPETLAQVAERDCLGVEAEFTGEGRFRLTALS